MAVITTIPPARRSTGGWTPASNLLASMTKGACLEEKRGDIAAAAGAHHNQIAMTSFDLLNDR